MTDRTAGGELRGRPVEAEAEMVHEFGAETWDRIYPQHAKILGLLADDLTEREVADLVNTSVDAVKSMVERLKVIFDCRSVRELRRTWRAVQP